MMWRSLLVVGALALLCGGLGAYGRYALLDERAFAARATSTLAQDEVVDEVIDRVSGRIVETQPELAPSRPLLEASVAEVVADPGFPAAFYAGMARLHHDLFTDGRRAPELVLPGTGAQLRSTFIVRARGLSPAAGAALSARVRRPGADAAIASDPVLMTLGGGRMETRLRAAAPTASRLASLWPAAVALGLILLGLAALLAPSRRCGLRSAALAVAVAGGATVAATAIGKALLLATFDTGHGDAVVGTIWNAYLQDLRLWGLLAGVMGLVAAAAADPGARGAWRRQLARALAPEGPGGRLARAAALLVLAVLLLVAPEVPLDLALITFAGLLVFSAAAELVRLSAR